jgi:peptidoglycan/LPS O-acetylase OafA/YrhL
MLPQISVFGGLVRAWSGRHWTLKRPFAEYYFGIDIVRFVCAISVAGFHLTWQIPEISQTLPFGWVGVEAFFVISGLVIANSANGASVQQYVAGRFLRIYPGAWCAALVNYPLAWWALATPGVDYGRVGFRSFLNSLALVELFPRGRFLASAYWTLPIEIAFYFLVFLLFAAKGFRHIQWLAIMLTAWSLPYLVALTLKSSGLVHWTWIDFGYGWKNMSLLRHGPYFGLGILVWLYKEKRITRAGIATAALALLLGFMEIYCRSVELLPRFKGPAILAQSSPIHLTMSSCAAFCFLIAAILMSVKFNQLFPTQVAARSTVRLLGIATYPFYLLHELVGRFVIYKMREIGLAPLPSVFVAFLCIGAAALVIAKYFEPALRSLLKRNIPALNPALEPRSQESTPR